jgi:hypothetical protein
VTFIFDPETLRGLVSGDLAFEIEPPGPEIQHLAALPFSSVLVESSWWNRRGADFEPQTLCRKPCLENVER